MSPHSHPESSRSEHARRSHRRYPINVEVEYKLIDGHRVLKTGSGLTLNLSSGGVLFACEDALPIGAAIRLTLTWPVLLNERAGLNLCVNGRIVRSFGKYTAVEILSHEFRTRPAAHASHETKTLVAAGSVSVRPFSV